jgi:hypothetical protein
MCYEQALSLVGGEPSWSIKLSISTMEEDFRLLSRKEKRLLIAYKAVMRYRSN